MKLLKPSQTDSCGFSSKNSDNFVRGNFEILTVLPSRHISSISAVGLYSSQVFIASRITSAKTFPVMPKTASVLKIVARSAFSPSEQFDFKGSIQPSGIFVQIELYS
ncbi:MAG TPA: hypothetical protein HA262_02585 [Methanosarcina sp.]|jgi:hypothetical protein|nr:hypothetical protein [Methanosarcina sp.]